MTAIKEKGPRPCDQTCDACRMEPCLACSVCGWPMDLHAVDSDEVFIDGVGFVACEPSLKEPQP